MEIFVFYTALSYYHKMHFIGLGHSLSLVQSDHVTQILASDWFTRSLEILMKMPTVAI